MRAFLRQIELALFAGREGDVDLLQKQFADDPRTFDSQKADRFLIRQSGAGAQAMERREILRLSVPRTNGSSEIIQTMDWSVEAFIPADKKFTIEVLHFHGLTLTRLPNGIFARVSRPLYLHPHQSQHTRNPGPKPQAPSIAARSRAMART